MDAIIVNRVHFDIVISDKEYEDIIKVAVDGLEGDEHNLCAHYVGVGIFAAIELINKRTEK